MDGQFKKGETPTIGWTSTSQGINDNYYIYTESTKNPNNTLTIESSERYILYSVTFWYHMYIWGSDSDASLNIELSEDGSNWGASPIKTYQRYDWYEGIEDLQTAQTVWKKETVYIPTEYNERQYIRFRAETKNEYSDIAIDNLILYHIDPPEPEPEPEPESFQNQNQNEPESLPEPNWSRT